MIRARALWFVGPRQVEISEVDVDWPRDGHVLVRTIASGISAGTERLAYRGEIDANLPLDETIGALGGTFTYPFRYGYSAVGVVEDGAGAIEPGALVFAFHPHQDVFAVPAGAVIAVDGVEPRHATLFPLVETALQIALDAGPRLGERVAVFGLGAVGLLAGLLLQRTGGDVVGVDPDFHRRDVAVAVGLPAVTPDVLADGSPGALSLVVEASGQPAALAAALPLLAHEGTALVASWYGTKPVTLPLGAEFHRRRLTIRSTQVSTIPARLANRWDVERRRRMVRDLLAWLPLDALATHTFPFEQAAEAYDAIDRGIRGLVHAALWYG